MICRCLTFVLCCCLLVLPGPLRGQKLNMDSCLQVLKTSKEDTNKVALLSDMAWSVSYQNLRTGIEYAKQSVDLAEKLGAERYYSRVYNVMGAIYADMSEQGKALDLFLAALKYAKKYNQYESQGFIYNSLGNFYSGQRDDKKALSYYLLAVQAHKHSGMPKSIYTPYNNLAVVYMELRRNDSAIYYVNLCIAYNEKNNDRERLVNNYTTLSEIYYTMRDFEKSLVYSQKAMDMVRQLNDKYTLSRALLRYGSALYANHKTKEAITAYDECFQLGIETGDLSTLYVVTRELSSIYDSLDNDKQALIYYKRHTIYKDSFISSENQTQMRAAEAKYEREKTHQTLELLAEKQKLSEAKRQQEKLYLYFAVAGILALVGLLALLFRNNRAEQKANKQLAQSNYQIKRQKELIEEKNKEITDSINYAKRIQQSILTSDQYFKKHVTDYFILFKPKDIVSGDFYWALQVDQKLMVMTADCTGHGVPGAMMSMMGINYLNEIVSEKKITAPAAVLNQLRRDIIQTLNPEGSLEEAKDGMDCSLCSFDFTGMKLRYANANNSFYVLRDKALITSQVNKMPVGAGHNSDQLFDEFEIALQKNDVIITLTDGFADQFGGTKAKKFKYRQLEELLVANSHLGMAALKQKLSEAFDQWKGTLDQVDDVCIVGIKV